VILYQGRSFKSYRGMGSSARWRAARPTGISRRMRPRQAGARGVEGQVPYKGSVAAVIHQLVGGLRAAMGYTGCATIAEMRRTAGSCGSPGPG
jgi:IMP dehydrogenase